MAPPLCCDAIKQAIIRKLMSLWGPASRKFLVAAVVMVNVSDFLALANLMPSHTMHVVRPYLVSSCRFRTLLKCEGKHTDGEANQQYVPEYIPGVDQPIFEEEPPINHAVTEKTTPSE